MAYERRDFSGAPTETTITAGINASDVSISIASATGWPTGSQGKFYVVIDPGTASEEKILVQSRSGTTLTIASAADRGADDTTAASHSSGATIYCSFSAQDADEANYWVAELAGAAAAASDIIIADGDNSLSKITKGSNSTVLRVDSGGTLGYGTITSAMIADDSIVNADINSAAAIDGSKLASNSVTETQLATSVAGGGLAGGNGTALSVNVDNSTVEIATDTLQVKDGGITAAKVAAAVAGSGLAGGAGSALSVNVDNSTIEINSDTLRVKDGGITQAKLANGLGGYHWSTIAPTDPSQESFGYIWVDTDEARLKMVDALNPITTFARVAHYDGAGRTGGVWTRATNQSISNATDTTVTFTAETADSDGFLTPTSGTVTIPTDLGGWYAYQFYGTLSAATSSATAVRVLVNGSTNVDNRLIRGSDTAIAISGVVLLAEGDTLVVQVFQTSGGALNLNPATLNLIRLAI